MFGTFLHMPIRTQKNDKIIILRHTVLDKHGRRSMMPKLILQIYIVTGNNCHIKEDRT